MIDTATSFALSASAPVEPLRALLSRRTFGVRQGILLASAARTTSTLGNLDMTGAKNLLLFGRCTAASGTGGLSLCVQVGAGTLSAATYAYAPTALTGTTVYWSCLFGVYGPRQTGTTAAFGDYVPVILPPTALVGVAAGDASSYTYELAYILS